MILYVLPYGPLPRRLPQSAPPQKLVPTDSPCISVGKQGTSNTLLRLEYENDQVTVICMAKKSPGAVHIAPVGYVLFPPCACFVPDECCPSKMWVARCPVARNKAECERVSASHAAAE